FFEGSIKRYFLRYSSPRNAHLPQVNSAFSDPVSLKNPLFMQPTGRGGVIVDAVHLGFLS
ncbi:MAG: hypothetical protein IKU22_08135, partial [Alistipes sp.]|nr:hypothetical protein [Alistipes sp.]